MLLKSERAAGVTDAVVTILANRKRQEANRLTACGALINSRDQKPKNCNHILSRADREYPISPKMINHK